jgi:hypothetical protein
MGIIQNIRDLSDGVSGLKNVHDTTLEMHNRYVKPALEKTQHRHELSIDMPSKAIINVPVLIKGTGTGMVLIYADGKLERKVFPDKEGMWYIRLYYSVVGEYIMEVKDSYEKLEKKIMISAN